MATLVLRSAGAAIGTALGGPLGGIVGGALGAVGGGVVDGLLANALTSRRNRAPQLDTLAITHAEEGAPVRKLWGRMRVGGNVIWCTQFLAVTSSQKTSSASGKGFGSSTKVTTFELSFAVAFCEGGDDVHLGRVWADGNELDLSQYGINFYNGSESQGPDGAIEAVEGVGAVPAYRGICYLVFNLMPLADFGNRMPQITAEILRRPPMPDPDDVTNTLRAVCMLPGAGEFVLGTQVYQSSDGFGNWFPENVHTPNGIPDFYSALDQLDAAVPARQAVSLVVSLVRHGSPRRRLPDRPQGRDRHQDGAPGRLGGRGLHPRDRPSGELDRSRRARSRRACRMPRPRPASCRLSAARRRTTRWSRRSGP